MPLTIFIRILEVVAIVESWLAAAWLFHHISPQKANSISRHGGADTATYLVFAFTLAAHAILFWIFSLIWIVPRFHPAAVFLPVASLAAIAQFATAWIRDGISPRLSAWHDFTAYTMAYVMPVILAILLATARLPLAAHIIIWCTLITQLTLMGIRFTVKTSAGHFLYYQSAYILCFQLSVIALAFTS